jgi:hemoglobin/transferrin/lactoferrin receptor protein
MMPRLLLLLFFPMSVAVAQDFLDPLVITASRSGRPASESSHSLDYLDGTSLRQNTVRTLPEALRYTPGVLVQKTAHGHGSPFIRGFTGRQNLLLMDGIRLNNSTFRSGPVQYWNTIDSFSLDHIELIRSQGSVLYGSDAVGGTLNAFGKSSRFRDREGAFAGGLTYYEFRSNGRGSHIGRIEADTGIGGKTGLLLGITAKEFGDIRDSSVGLMRGTGHPEQDFDARIDWAVTPDSTITLAHYDVHQDGISRWHRTSANPGWTHGRSVTAAGDWTANTFSQDRSLTYLRHAGTDPRAGAFIKSWSATLSHQTTGETEFQNRLGAANPGSRPIRGSTVDVETLGIDLTLESPAGTGTLVYGFDYYHDEVDSAGYQTNAANSNRIESLPVADDSEYDLFGAFALYSWQATERLEITGGIRHTRAGATLGRYQDSTGTMRGGDSQNWDATVGSLRALYHLSETWNLFGGVSQAFRAPNLDDLSGNLTARAGSQTIGSTDVDPERYLTCEIGARHTGETVSFSAAIFHTDADDLIVGVPITQGSSTTVATNASAGYVYGIEVEGAWRFHPQWTLSGFAAWQDARSETADYLGGPASARPNSRQLPLTGSLALRRTSDTEKWWAEGRILAAAREDRVTAADQAADSQRIPTHGTPSYLVSSLRAGWRASENLELTGALENLTDVDHRTHGSGQNEPGFNAILAVRITW